MIEQELSGIRQPDFHKQGANSMEVAKIQERLAAGDSAEKISSDMMICLECVQSFVGKDTDASNFEAMVAQREKTTGTVERNIEPSPDAKAADQEVATPKPKGKAKGKGK